jgi:hypothetical protein
MTDDGSEDVLRRETCKRTRGRTCGKERRCEMTDDRTIFAGGLDENHQRNHREKDRGLLKAF